MRRVYTAMLHGMQHHNNKAIVREIERTPRVRVSERETPPDRLKVELECGSIITITEDWVYNTKD